MVFKENLSDLTSFGGLPLYLFAILIFFLIGNFGMASQLILGLVLAYVILFIVRTFYFKKRPKKQKYENWLEKIDSSSFPSAHAIRATVLGILIANFLSDIFVSLVIILVVFLSGYIRVKLKQHDWIDVVAGWIF